MNCTYRLIWSERLHAFIVAAENTRSRGKASGLKALAAVLLSAVALSAHALPEGGAVADAAQGSIGAPVNGAMTITQTLPKMVIDWTSFNIGEHESVVFNQEASHIALNRVTGTESSTLLGYLTGKGQVWLLNPKGVQIGRGATIAVGGWLASTLDVKDADFMAANFMYSEQVWTGTGGSVTNQGDIATTPGGYVALLGGTVSNTGIITARLGTVALAAGKQITLDFNGDKLLNVQVDAGVAGAQAHNTGEMTADGGTVWMTAKGMDALLTSVVNNDGVIRAQTVVTGEGSSEGRIFLLGGMDGGVTRVAGTLDASAPDGNGSNGGDIETEGATVEIADSAQITTKATTGKTGLWLINSNDYTIAASGGNITGKTLSDNLNNTDVTISTALQGTPGGNGDIHGNDAVTWNAPTTLTLTAHRHINVNASITAGSTAAGLTLTPGAGGVYTLNRGAQINLKAGATLAIAGKNYTVINTVEALQGMKDKLDGSYALGSDVDASATKDWNSGEGFVPVTTLVTEFGSIGTGFSGILDGLGHQVKMLTIYRPGSVDVGLIGYNTGTVRMIAMTDVNVTGSLYVGGLVGRNNGSISDVYATGTVKGKIDTGGLVGLNLNSISDAYATGTVTGFLSTGGLVGYNTRRITNAYATGSVIGSTETGQLVGRNGDKGNNGNIANAYASGTVNTVEVTNSTIIGQNNNGTLTNVSALSAEAMKQQTSFNYDATTGEGFDFTNTWRIYEGHTTPLLRAFLKPITVTVSDATKTYDGKAFAGLIEPKYSIDGAQLNGDLIYGSDSQPAINAGRYGLSGLWSTTYDISYANGKLTVNPAALTVTAKNAIKTYGQVVGFNGSTDFTVSDGLAVTDKIDKVSLSSAGSIATAGVQTGGYAITANDATGTFNAANYDITYVDGKLTVNPAVLTVTATDASKTYGQVASFTGSEFTSQGLVNGDTVNTVSLSSAGSLATAGVQTGGYAITASDATGTFNAANYDITYVDGTLTINPKSLTATFSAMPTKVYDGKYNANLAGIGFSLNGLVEIDNVTESINITRTSEAGTYDSKDVGTGIGITADLKSAIFTAATGTFLTNYILPTKATGAGSITPAPLRYVARKESVFVNAPFPDSFGGTVDGFVNGESLPIPNSVVWKTMATAKSIPGSYAIDGSGFDPGNNYSIDQDAGNATALTITPIPGCTKKKC